MQLAALQLACPPLQTPSMPRLQPNCWSTRRRRLSCVTVAATAVPKQSQGGAAILLPSWAA